VINDAVWGYFEAGSNIVFGADEDHVKEDLWKKIYGNKRRFMEDLWKLDKKCGGMVKFNN